MGGFWYKLDAVYRNKRRWTCARGCGARIHTIGKKIVFSELKHRCRDSRELVYTSGYPRLKLHGYVYRPHNAYRRQPKVLWYCAGRHKFQCSATAKTYFSKLMYAHGRHNHEC
ncbi:unnamed protein product [Leptosia nina]|uniref:FLYWCH-type domain-containing protein n=1 Tax=Leptosia nina TaxID=320188 RepID=A0AAV1J5U1_9NEOP